MIELDGRAYTVKTAAENTSDMLTTINEYCANHDIRNSKGELVYIEAKMSSPIYCILWALGYLVTIIQNLIYSVGASNNVQAASDTQLLNIAQMANIKRAQASLTTVTLMVTAMSDDNPNYDATSPGCTITSENTVTIDDVIYKPALHPSITLEPGDSKPITLVAQSAGSHAISENTITSFDETIINLDSVRQPEPAIPGQDIESIASLRQRIQRRQLSGTSIDTAISAIRELPGITLCNIYYNPSTQFSISIGQTDGLDIDYVEVPARFALIIVQGYNSEIGKRYLDFLTAPTVPFTTKSTGEVEYSLEGMLFGNAINRVLEVQIYTTHAHQQIPVLIMKPRIKPVYIKVYIGVTLEKHIVQDMKNAISDIALNLTAGQSITSAMVLNALADYTAYQLNGAVISSDEGETYGYKSEQQTDLLWSINAQNIRIEMPGVS